MAKYEDEDGVWRTIGGRRVFIKTGQSLEEAMKESGKFNTTKTKKEEDKYMPERTKAVGDYQNGAIDRDELLKRFDGNEERMNQTFEQLGYTAPTKENIERANENARKRAELLKEHDELLRKSNHAPSNEEAEEYYRQAQKKLDDYYETEKSGSKTYKSKDLEQGKPYSIDYGNGIKKTAVFVGKDENGNNMFYDGEGVDGRFAFSDRFLDESVKITDNKDDDKFIELHNQIKGTNKQKSAKEKLEEMVNSRKKLGKDIDNYYKQTGTETGLTEKARQEIISGYDNYDDAISNFAEEHDIPRYRAEEYFEKARKKLGVTTASLKGEEENKTSSAINDKIREQARRSQEKQKELQQKVASSGDDVAEEMRYADDRATFRKISKTYGYDNLSDNEIKEVLDFAEKRGLYHSKEEIATMRRYLDSRVLRNEFDTYKKEHPESKMSFTEWKKNNKK